MTVSVIGCYLDDGRDELLQEGVLQQRRPVVVEEVDQQPFDMGAVSILSGGVKGNNMILLDDRLRK